MARYPLAGRVKTRLAREIGADQACRMYRAFILDLADRLRALPHRVTWVYEPADAAFSALLPNDRGEPQVPGDLGRRMAHAVERRFAEGADAVLVIGADVPHVSMADVAATVQKLGAGTDVVLGPAADGGYVLIGLSRAHPALFEGVDWGTNRVLGTTVATARRLHLTVHLLPPSFDVDEAGDLDRLRGLIARGMVDLPRSARLLGLADAVPLDSVSRRGGD